MSSIPLLAPAQPPSPLSLHDALPIFHVRIRDDQQVTGRGRVLGGDRGGLGQQALASLLGVALPGELGELRAERRRADSRSEEHTSELQSRGHLVCRLLLEKKKKTKDE